MFTFCEQVPTSEQEEKPPLHLITVSNGTRSVSFSKRSWPRPPGAHRGEQSGFVTPGPGRTRTVRNCAHPSERVLEGAYYRTWALVG